MIGWEFVLVYIALASALIIGIAFVQGLYHRWWWKRHGDEYIADIVRKCQDANEKEWRR